MEASTKSMPARRSPLRLGRFSRDVLWYSLARIGPALLSGIGVFIFSRRFTPAEFGTYSVAYAAVAAVLVILTEWVAQPAARFYKEYAHSGRLPVYSSTLMRLVTVSLAATVVAALTFLAVGWELWGWQMALAAAFFLVLQALISMIMPILPASLDSRAFTMFQTMLPAIQMLFAVTLVSLFSPNPAWLMWGWVCAAAIVFPAAFFRVRRHLVFEEGAASRDSARFLRFGLPMLFWLLCAQLLNFADRFLIQYYRGSEEVGIYSVNYNLVSGIGAILGFPIVFAAFPLILDLWAQKRVAEIGGTLRRMTELYAFVAFGLLGLLMCEGGALGDYVVGPRFHEGMRIFVPVFAGMILWYSSMLGNKGLELAERPQIIMAIAMLSVGVNVLLNIAFIPKYGYVAAAYTTLASYAFYTTCIWLSVRSSIPWDIPWMGVLVYAVAMLLSAAAAAALPQDSIVWVVARLAVFGSLFCLGAILRWKDLRAAVALLS